MVLALIAASSCSRENDTPTIAGGTTVFGSTVDREPGESVPDAFTRLDEQLGPLRLLRIYSAGLPPSWEELHRQVGARSTVVSFKADPLEITSGAFDQRLRSWFQDAPRHRETWWTYFHEPENNVEAGHFSAEEFRAAWVHVAALAASVDNPRLHATLVLMCYTLQPASGRTWRDYVPDDGSVEVLAWDCYSLSAGQGGYMDPDALLGDAVEASRAVDAGWGVAELGSRVAAGDDGTLRAAWLKSIGTYAVDNGAAFVTYFNSGGSGDLQLTDEPSIVAWRSLITR